MKNTRIESILITLTVLLTSQYLLAGTSPLADELSSSYYYSDHYEITINQPAEKVWPHLINLGSWIYEFDMLHESGPTQAEGEILRLYKGQDFLMEIVKTIPNKLLVAVNLPASQKGEDTQGITMMSLSESQGQTVVSVFMSRIYTWHQPEPNPLRAVRDSDTFKQNRQVYFAEKFLPRLRDLVEEQ